MTDPLTLPEFEHEAHATIRAERWAEPTRPSEQIVASLRPLVLRVLAGERERCAAALESDGRMHRQTQNDIRATECAWAAHRVRNMGDPT